MIRIGELMKIITEGNTKLKVPKDRTLSKKDKIFYNPIMEINRDISVSVIQSFLNNYKRDEFIICDPLGGSGARGLRYAKELKNPSGTVKVVIGDITEPLSAVISISKASSVSSKVPPFNVIG